MPLPPDSQPGVWRRYRRRVLLVATAAVVFLLCLAQRPLLRVVGVRAAPPAELTIFLTADTRGHLEPCGCRQDQSGGLPVRSTLLARDKSLHRLLIDAGNLTHGTREYDLVKLDYVLRGMAKMRYDVVNLGPNEALLDKAQLSALVRKHSSLTFVSCNTVGAKSRRPVVDPFAVRAFDGFRVGVVGVTRGDLEIVGDGLAVLPPLEALAQWIPRVAKRCDYLLVAAFVDRPTMEEIARRFYEVDGVLGGDVPQSSGQPEDVNGAVLFAVTDLGKVLGRINLKRSEKGRLEVADGEGVKVKDSLPADPKILSVVEAFKAELKRRRIEFAESQDHLEPVAPPPRSAAADRYVGAQDCKDCHRQAFTIWRKSKHGQSFETLEPRNNQYDPECLPCHTLGYGAGDGYVSEAETPKLATVQCESCHGRGRDHAEAYRRGEPPAISTLRVVTPNTCIQCHDEENSANFSFATFWPKIEHAEPARGRTRSTGD